jgi:hypothetical protein
MKFICVSLRYSGLLVGLSGAIWGAFSLFTSGDSRYTWYSLPGILITIIPLLVVSIIGFRWPLLGGSLFFVEGNILLFFYFSTWLSGPYYLSPLNIFLSMLSNTMLFVALCPLASGTFFLLSWICFRFQNVEQHRR